MSQISKTWKIIIFIAIEVAICIAGVTGVAVSDMWEHPLRVFLTAATLMIVAFIAAVANDFEKYRTKRRTFKPKTNKKNESKNRVA